jgi:glyoxylase-like metal-dependent hydrolase (beta-lactamase superfamily II)
LGAVDCVVLSHLHPDHVGGPRSMFRRTFSAGPDCGQPRAVTAFVPTEMTHRDADVCVVDEARVVGPGRRSAATKSESPDPLRGRPGPAVEPSWRTRRSRAEVRGRLRRRSDHR